MDTYQHCYTRPLPLFSCQYWQRAERFAVPALVENVIHHDPLFEYIPAKGVAVYYNVSDAAQQGDALIDYVAATPAVFDSIAERFEKEVEAVKTLRPHSGNGDSFQVLDRSISVIWPLLSVVDTIAAAADDRIRGMTSRAYELRSMNEQVLYFAERTVRSIMRHQIPPHLRDYVDFVTREEYLDTLCSADELEERTHGFVFFQDRIYPNASIFDVAAEHDVLIYAGRENERELVGDTACRGAVRGTARVIFEPEQMDRVEEGDILVTPMTTPDFLPAMKRAAGFVTDEGGITCHAAIVAREMGKPCVIGTERATEVLKDGETVHLDANQGLVHHSNNE